MPHKPLQATGRPATHRAPTLLSFSSSTRSSMAPMDLMMLSARRSAWSTARATPAFTSSTVSAVARSCEGGEQGRGCRQNG